MEFSSTETYANQYDLDEIDVFLEGNSSNPMFFNVSGIPQNLSYGKHYFNFFLLDSSNLEYKLREGSRVLFEVKSKNGVIVKSDVSDVNQRNGVVTCFVELLENPLRTYREIQDGQGTLTVVGSLENKPNTQELIPDKFLGAMNYRCVFPINIAKNILNSDSPFILQTEHKTTTTLGQFSFAKASISPLKNSAVGLEYNTSTGLPKTKVLTVSSGRSPS